MRIFAVFIILLLFSITSNASSLVEESSYYRYQVKQDEWLGSILRKMGIRPLWGEEGWAAKVAVANRLDPEKAKVLKIFPGQWLNIPKDAFPKKKTEKVEINEEGQIALLPQKKKYSLKFNISCEWEEGKSNCQTELDSDQPVDSLGGLSFSSNFVDSQVQFAVGENGQPVFTKTAKTIGKSVESVEEEVEKTIVEQMEEVELKPKAQTIVVEDKVFQIPQWEPTFNQAEESDREIASIPPRKNFYFPRLGYSSHSYSQGADINVDSQTLTAVMAYRKIILPPRWHLDANLNFTAATLSQTGSDAEARYVDLNLRGGYALPFLKEPWRFTIFGGIYYTTMLVDDDSFGYSSLFYPQIYPELRRVFRNGDTLTFTGRYVPTSRSFNVFDFSERAISLGVQWTRLTSWKLPLTVGAEFSSFKFTAESGSEIDSQSLSLTLGTGF